MAEAIELFTSRLGGVRGINGAQGLTTTWKVTTDNQADDATASEAVFAAGFPRLGTIYPWTGFGLVAIAYRERARWSPTVWLYDVIYGAPITIDPARPWNIEITASGETEHIFRDLQGRLIGPFEYVKVPKIQVGSPAIFEDDDEAIAALPGLHKNVNTNTRYTSGGIEFFQVPEKRAVGLPRLKKAGTLTLSGRVDYITDSQLGAIIARVTRINTDSFFGGPKFTIQFRGMQASAVTANEVGQQVAGLAYDVRMIFEWNMDEHSPVEEFDTITNDKGEEGFVTTQSGDLVSQIYDIYEAEDLSAFLAGAFRGGKTPYTPPPRAP